MAAIKKEYRVGVDLGATKMLAAVFDTKWNLLGSAKRKTKEFSDAANGMKRVEQTISEALGAAKIPAEKVAGIGIGSPGPVDSRKGLLLDPPNLGAKQVPVRDLLGKVFDSPIHVLNDVDAGTYGEYRFGAGRRKQSVLGVFPGTGIGGGYVFDGTIIQGAHISCMEIGHLCVQPGGPFCGCGQRGCLEAVAGRLAIAQATAAAAYRGKAPYLLENVGTDIAKMRSKVLADAIKNGDSVVEEIVREAAAWLGRGVAMVVNLLAPDIVILGGGLVEALPDLYLKETEQSARQFVMPTFRDRFSVAVAELGDDASVRGAAAWAAQCKGPQGGKRQL